MKNFMKKCIFVLILFSVLVIGLVLANTIPKKLNKIVINPCYYYGNNSKEESEIIKVFNCISYGEVKANI